MKTILRFLSILGLSTLLWTCSEDFLETPPQGILSFEALSTADGTEAALVSAYARLDGWANDWGLSGWGGATSNWLWGSVTSDDTHKGSEPADGVENQQLELYQWAPSFPDLASKFRFMYDGVRRANETLQLMAAASDISDADRTRIEGEARFLRAHYHMELWKMWKNVPYVDENVQSFRIPNDQDIFPMIVADFEAAAAALPVTQGDIGRATRGAAYAMLGRLHMLNNDMASAKTALDQVTGYSLSDCYHDMFSVEGENGPEMIFSYQASVNDGTGDGANGNFGERLAFPHAGSPFGCCGFNQPTQNLVNAYRVDDDGLPLNDNSFDNNPTADEPIDPRLDWIVGRDGVPYLNWGIHEPSWIRDRTYSSEYSPKKFIHDDGESSSVGWSNNHLSPVNVPIIRYADVLLMLAEIDVANNQLEDAREKVNMIRARAGNCAQGADEVPVALDDASTTHATYRVSTYDDTWTDQDAAREAVRLERRLELALEGHRWFDLRRYNADPATPNYLFTTINNYLDVEEERRVFLQQAVRPQERHLLFPIPSAAIQLSQIDGTPTLRQNPGW